MPRLPAAVLLLLTIAPGQAAPTPGDHQPNVLLIISDDQAWTDFGFMGHPAIATPHLDALAARSAVFEHGYVPTSLCRPSLATMITGLYPHEHQITGNDPPKGTPRERMLQHIEAAQTLPELLAQRGYRSLQTGKWWEGNCTCGGFTAGMTHGDPKRGGRHGDVGLQIGRQTMQPIRDFLAECDEADAPFFLWYAPFLPHTPHNPPERLLKKYRADDRSIHVAKYFAMCEWFDETCGQLLAMLDERGMTNDTLVLFVVDNGWIQRENGRSFAPRSKRSPYEGGIRTPIMVAWPGHVEPGRRDALASSIDLAPTVLVACGVERPDTMAGQDLLAVCRGDTPARDAAFGATFTHDVVEVGVPAKSLRHRWIVLHGWKLIVAKDADRGSGELFHLAEDPHETNDLASSNPDRVAALRQRLDAWWNGRPNAKK